MTLPAIYVKYLTVRRLTMKKEDKNKLVLNIIKTANRLQSVGNVFFKPFGITSSQYNILVLLRSKKEGMSQVEISKNMLVSRSNITSLIDKLEKSGLVKRMDKENDRRRDEINITSKGLELIKKIEKKYYEQVNKVVPKSIEKDISRLNAIFDLWINFLDEEIC